MIMALSSFFIVVGVNGLSLNRLGVDFDTRAHCARKINALDIGAFSSSGFELDESVHKLAGVVAHSLCGEGNFAD